MKRFFAHLTPSARLAMGLVSLIVTLLLLIDLGLNLVPDQSEMQRKIRESTSERLAVQMTSLIQAQEWSTLKLTADETVTRDKDILSLAVRQHDGRLLFQSGDHLHHWVPPARGQSTITHVNVPITAQGSHWGDVEISYRPTTPQSLLEWLQVPLVALMLVVMPVAFLVFYLYLRRALQYLDPASAVPDRVRLAFDVLAEGVVVVDRAGQIMLSNKAFGHLHPDASANMIGRALSGLPWLKEGKTATESAWEEVMRKQVTVSGHQVTISQPDHSTYQVIVNAAPILDSPSKLRGCIVTFYDMTELHRLNQQLTLNLAELDASRIQIEKKNEELRLLATRDPLTGCLNRRAFVAEAEPMLPKMRQEARNMSCLMVDIDFFKKVNDMHGHLVGDQVIVAMARAVAGQLRLGDLLCRFGGEEFCLVLPDTSDEVAMEVAERIRTEVALHVGGSVRTVEGMHVTCSLGVASLKLNVDNLLGLIELADLALYHSKENGRNRATLWSEHMI